MATNLPISDTLIPAAQHTLTLVAGALVVSVAISVPLGVYLAKRADSWIDIAANALLNCLVAIPWFVVGIVLILLFAVKIQAVPVESSGAASNDLGMQVRSYILPIVTATFAIVPHLTRMTRAVVQEQLSSSYVQAVTLRGLSTRRITWRHVFPNAAGAVINAVALDVIWLLGAVIVIEYVFGFPGLGSLLMSSIEAGDLISVQAITVMTGGLFIGISWLADVLVTAVDPRLDRSGTP